MDNFLESLEQKAVKRIELFHERFPENEKLLNLKFELLGEILIAFRKKSKKDVEKAVSLQAYRCFNCSWTAYQNIKVGFLSEAAAVTLTALNSSLYIEYFFLKPHISTRWLDGTHYPIQSFRKLLPEAEFNHELSEALTALTNYGLTDIPRELAESKTLSFHLGGIDDLEKQRVLITLLSKLLSKAINLLIKICKEYSTVPHEEFVIKAAAIREIAHNKKT